MRRKKWWAVSTFEFSWKVQFFYYLGVILIVFAVPSIMQTQFFPPKIDERFMWTLIYLAAFGICVWRFVVGAKREYEEKNLG